MMQMSWMFRCNTAESRKQDTQFAAHSEEILMDMCCNSAYSTIGTEATHSLCNWSLLEDSGSLLGILNNLPSSRSDTTPIRTMCKK